MSGPELLLDSSIRLWVVLPIVFITFFVGIIRHYVTQLLHSDKKVDLEQVSDRWAPILTYEPCAGPHVLTQFLRCCSCDGVCPQSGADAQPHSPREWKVHPPAGEPTQLLFTSEILLPGQHHSCVCVCSVIRHEETLLQQCRNRFL